MDPKCPMHTSTSVVLKEMQDCHVKEWRVWYGSKEVAEKKLVEKVSNSINYNGNVILALNNMLYTKIISISYLLYF